MPVWDQALQFLLKLGPPKSGRANNWVDTHVIGVPVARLINATTTRIVRPNQKRDRGVWLPGRDTPNGPDKTRAVPPEPGLGPYGAWGPENQEPGPGSRTGPRPGPASRSGQTRPMGSKTGAGPGQTGAVLQPKARAGPMSQGPAKASLAPGQGGLGKPRLGQPGWTQPVPRPGLGLGSGLWSRGAGPPARP